MQAKVKMLRVSAGPTGVLQVGDIITVSKERADRMVADGVGEIVGLIAAQQETGMVSQAPERAARPKAKPKRKVSK